LRKKRKVYQNELAKLEAIEEGNGLSNDQLDRKTLVVM